MVDPLNVKNSFEPLQSHPPQVDELEIVNFLDRCAMTSRSQVTTIRDNCSLMSDLFGLLRECEDPLFSSFIKAFNVPCSQDEGMGRVKKIFDDLPAEEVKTLLSLTEWYCLLRLGGIYQEDSVQTIKSLIGVHYCVDIINSDVQLNQTSGLITIEELSEFIDNPSMYSEKSPAFTKIATILSESFLNVISVMEIVAEITNFAEFPIEILNEGRSFLNDLTTQERLRWALFIAVVGALLCRGNEGITAKPDEWPQSIPPQGLRLAKAIDRELANLRMPFKCHSAIEFIRDASRNKPVKEPVLTSIDLPGFPNVMPNGWNSCYISSVLWSLFFVAGKEVREAVSNEECSEDPFRTFKALFEDMASEDRKAITTDQVNAFRKSMQLKFPTAFSNPQALVQEDAYDFLVCVMTDFLKLGSCSAQASKFVVNHKYFQAEDRPLVDADLFDYEEALKTTFSPEPLPIFDIRLNDKSTSAISLKTLVSQPRICDKIERHAYSRQMENNGIRYQTINAEHIEQLLVESKETAPAYFIGRLSRFCYDYHNNRQEKRLDQVMPNATLEFSLKGKEDTGEIVPYDLDAVIVHSGDSIDQGHYYTYIRKKVDGNWKCFVFDDLFGSSECEEEAMVKDVAQHGYLYFYSKREGEEAPPPLKVEKEMEPAGEIKATKARIPIPIRTKPLKPLQKNTRRKAASRAVRLVNRGRRANLKIGKVKPSATGRNSGCKVQSCVQKPEVRDTIEWISRNLSATFKLNLEGTGPVSMAKLLLTILPKNQTFSPTEVDSVITLSDLAKALQRPIYIVARNDDRELTLVDKYPIPGDNFRCGEDFTSAPLYIIGVGTGWMLLDNQ